MSALQRVDATLAALADPVRREVVDLLARGPRSAGELARLVQAPAPAMSRHLKALRTAGLVSETHPEFDARVRIYSLRAEPMTELIRWLEEAERLWTDQLLAFKAHIEAEEGEASP